MISDDEIRRIMSQMSEFQYAAAPKAYNEVQVKPAPAIPVQAQTKFTGTGGELYQVEYMELDGVTWMRESLYILAENILQAIGVAGDFKKGAPIVSARLLEGRAIFRTG